LHTQMYFPWRESTLYVVLAPHCGTVSRTVQASEPRPKTKSRARFEPTSTPPTVVRIATRPALPCSASRYWTLMRRRPLRGCTLALRPDHRPGGLFQPALLVTGTARRELLADRTRRTFSNDCTLGCPAVCNRVRGVRMALIRFAKAP